MRGASYFCHLAVSLTSVARAERCQGQPLAHSKQDCSNHLQSAEHKAVTPAQYGDTSTPYVPVGGKSLVFNNMGPVSLTFHL